MASFIKHLATELRSLRHAANGADTLESPALVGEILPPSPAAAADTPPAWTPLFVDHNKRKTGSILDNFSCPLSINPDCDPAGWTSNTVENQEALQAAHDHAQATGEPQVIPPLKLMRRPPVQPGR